MSPTIEIMWDEGADRSIGLPVYASEGAAGADIRANFSGNSIDLHPNKRALVPTGLRLAIPEGYEVQIRPRSGLALKSGISIPNSPGTIDSDYRGPLGVILVNMSDEPYTINHGDRIAQMVLAPVVRAKFSIVAKLASTLRGQGGFGSTGTN